MYSGYVCFVVYLTVLVSVCHQAAGSLGRKRAFMSHTGSDGSVHTMGSDSHGSFMFNSNSNKHQGGHNVDEEASASLPDWDTSDEPSSTDMFETGFAALLNSLLDIPYTDDSASSLALPEKIIYNANEASGVRRVTFSDGSFDYVTNTAAKQRPGILSETSEYQFPSYRRDNRIRGHRHRKVSSSKKGKGGSGGVISVSDGNGADAVDGGADGSVQVRVSRQHHDRVTSGTDK